MSPSLRSWTTPNVNGNYELTDVLSPRVFVMSLGGITGGVLPFVNKGDDNSHASGVKTLYWSNTLTSMLFDGTDYVFNTDGPHFVNPGDVVNITGSALDPPVNGPQTVRSVPTPSSLILDIEGSSTWSIAKDVGKGVIATPQQFAFNLNVMGLGLDATRDQIRLLSNHLLKPGQIVRVYGTSCSQPLTGINGRQMVHEIIDSNTFTLINPNVGGGRLDFGGCASVDWMTSVDTGYATVTVNIGVKVNTTSGVITTERPHGMIVNSSLTLTGTSFNPDINGPWVAMAILSDHDFRIRPLVNRPNASNTGQLNVAQSVPFKFNITHIDADTDRIVASTPVSKWGSHTRWSDDIFEAGDSVTIFGTQTTPSINGEQRIQSVDGTGILTLEQPGTGGGASGAAADKLDIVAVRTGAVGKVDFEREFNFTVKIIDIDAETQTFTTSSPHGLLQNETLTIRGTQTSPDVNGRRVIRSTGPGSNDDPPTAVTFTLWNEVSVSAELS